MVDSFEHATRDGRTIGAGAAALCRGTLAAVVLCLVAEPPKAHAQMRWRVDPKASLAWWQVAPHMDHLWATTCPEEPSWQAGEGRSAGWRTMPSKLPDPAYSGDTTRIPLYPRYWALPVCTEAVDGRVIVDDTTTWRGVRGRVTVQAAALLTGDEARDAYTRGTILQTSRHPETWFTIDSVVNVTRQADTLRGTAMGEFSLRDVLKPMTATVQAWPDAGGLRVLARFRVPASQLVPEYGLSAYALGFGVGLRIWQYLFMGVDVVLRAEEGGSPVSR